MSSAIINPTPPIVGGNFNNPGQVGYGSGAGYLFQSGNIPPQVSADMTYLLNQFYAAMVFERIGRSEAIPQSIWQWPELGFLLQGSTVTDIAGTGAGTTSRTFTTTQLSSQPYFIPKMTLLTDYGVALNVDSVNNSGTYQVLTVYLQDTSGTWAAATGQAGAASGLTLGIGQLATSDAEYQTGVDPQIAYPNFIQNRLNLIKGGWKMSRDFAKSRVYTPDGKSYYYEQDIQMTKRMFVERDNAIMFHQWDGTTTSGKRTGNGLFPILKTRGQNSIVDGAIQEDDILDMLKKLRRQSEASEFLVFGGSDALTDVARALRPYAVSGFGNPSMFNDKTMAGISCTQYYLGVLGLTLTFVYLPQFDNSAVTPYTGTYAGTASSGQINFRSMLMFLNMGSDNNGKKLITLKHLEDSNFLQGYVNGTIGIDGKPASNGSASTLDGAERWSIMDVGVEVRNAAAHGLMYRQDA